MARFRVALSPDVRHKGKVVFDLSPLTSNPDIEIGFVEPENGIMPASVLADYDALILLFPRFPRESIPSNHRLGLIAKFGLATTMSTCPPAQKLVLHSSQRRTACADHSRSRP
jgi:hypothetical protein